MLLVRPALLALFTLATAEPDAPFRIARLLYSDDFAGGLNQWTAELEKPGVVEVKNGVLHLDVPAGATVWFRPELRGPVMIQYEATMIGRGGANDRVSDLNCFWMASDARSPQNLFATKRSGKFADYNQLRAYYVGQGGNYEHHDALPPLHRRPRTAPAVTRARSGLRRGAAESQRDAENPTGSQSGAHTVLQRRQADLRLP